MKHRYLNCRFFAGIFFLALSTASAQGKGGEIKGKITVSRDDDLTGSIIRGRSLHRYETGGAKSDKPLDPPYALPEKAVIYIEAVGGNYDPPAAHPALDQRDMVFRPLVLPILVGTTVDFPNSDPLFHNVFSLSQAREFDLGRYPKGEKKSVVFNKPGIVSVYCEIHSYMFATILVLENPFFTVPDDDGNFTIAGIPAGTYQLNFWYGRKKAETRTVTVTEHQTTTENFSY